jgi:hypothetical protein
METATILEILAETNWKVRKGAEHGGLGDDECQERGLKNQVRKRKAN